MKIVYLVSSKADHWFSDVYENKADAEIACKYLNGTFRTRFFEVVERCLRQKTEFDLKILNQR